ncbi:MAG: response regulator transcription factor, partial [Polyangiaceae bacterium]
IIILLQRCAAGVETTPLTPAERRVLEALAEGYPTKEIAAVTGRSSKTVNNQITSILRKLQARSRGEAVARARRRGLLNEKREPATV